MNDREVKYLEVQLLDWSKSTARKGPRLVLQLQSDEDVAYFEQYTTAKGKMAGQLFDVAFSLSEQDGQAEEMKGGPYAREAVFLAQDRSFQGFVRAGTMGLATEYIKRYCGIESRRELDNNEQALSRFLKLRKLYAEWLQDDEL